MREELSKRMQEQTRYLFLLFVLLLNAPYTLAQSNATINIAVVVDKTSGLDKSPLISLLEVQLSQKQGIELLERSAIDEILREQQLSLAGLLDRDAIVEAGQLLRADAFILLSQESPGAETRPTRQQPVDEFDEDLSQPDNSTKGKLIRVRVVETAHGLRLLDRFEELDAEKLEEVTERIIKEIIAVAGKLNLPAGQAIPIGIVDIHRVQLGERHKLLERALPVLLSVRLSKEPKIIMLEREDLKILLDEKLLTEGRDSEFWGSAILIDGYLQPKDSSLEMTLQLRQASGQEIGALAVKISFVPIGTPFPYIAANVVQPQFVGGFLFYGHSPPFTFSR